MTMLVVNEAMPAPACMLAACRSRNELSAPRALFHRVEMVVGGGGPGGVNLELRLCGVGHAPDVPGPWSPVQTFIS
jgi:hypothetical protein